MTISNGSVITAADLASLTTAPLLAMRVDNAQVPCGEQINFPFNGLVASTPAASRTAVFVLPHDILVETVGCNTFLMTAASRTTVTVVCDATPTMPIVVESATSAALVRFARLAFDGVLSSKTDKDFSTTSRAVRVWPRGSTVTVTVSTTSVATTSTCHVYLSGRSFLARE